MPIHEAAALLAALSWAVAGLVSLTPSRALGAMGFVRLRMGMVFAALALVALITGGWGTLTGGMAVPLIVSGAIGIFVGDVALFAAMNRLGPRMAGLLFATNAPMAALLGRAVLGEVLDPAAMLGVALTFAGVGLAVFYGRPRRGEGSWLERVEGPLAVGVAIGLVAGLAQAIGVLAARPVMQAGADPVAASAVRVGIGALTLQTLVWGGYRPARFAAPLTSRLIGLTAVSGLLAMGIGMTAVMFALAGSEAGIVSTLSATTPVMILPLLWWSTGHRPRAPAWVGAALTVAGAALLFG